MNKKKLIPIEEIRDSFQTDSREYIAKNPKNNRIGIIEVPFYGQKINVSLKPKYDAIMHIHCSNKDNAIYKLALVSGNSVSLIEPFHMFYKDPYSSVKKAPSYYFDNVAALDGYGFLIKDGEEFVFYDERANIDREIEYINPVTETSRLNSIVYLCMDIMNSQNAPKAFKTSEHECFVAKKTGTIKISLPNGQKIEYAVKAEEGDNLPTEIISSQKMHNNHYAYNENMNTNISKPSNTAERSLEE